MKEVDHYAIAKRVAAHIVAVEDPCDGLEEVVRVLAEDGDINGQDMLKIFTGALLFTARTLDTAAQTSIAALVPLLILLYPNKSIDELSEIAGNMLRRMDGEPAPQVRFVVIQHRGD